jgi:hypothetical protein
VHIAEGSREGRRQQDQQQQVNHGPSGLR